MDRNHRLYLTRRSFLKLLGGTTAAAALSACGTTDTPAAPEQSGEAATLAEPQRGGTLRLALFEVLTSFDPALIFLLSDYYAGLATHEGLTWIDADGVLQPVLATAWEQSDDLLTWTFTLREGVTFHHGPPFTAEDVVFTFERILNPDLGATFAANLTMVERLEAIDDTTVRFHLSSPHVDLARILASPFALIVPHDRSNEQLASEPSGTGPFRLGDNQPGERVTLVRNADYWQDGLPYLDELQLVVMADSAAQVNALTSGTVEVLESIGFESIPVLEADAATRVIEVPGGSSETIWMQVTEPPFDDVRVRQALKHCVNREGLIQALLQGHGVVGNDQPIPPISPFWADLPPLEQDIDKAKELLAEAGYPDGLTFTLTTSAVIPRMADLAVAFQEMAKPAGITIEIERVPAETFWSDYYGQVPCFTADWSLAESDDVNLTLAFHSEGFYNASFYANLELDALIEQARAETDEEQRADLYAQIQQIIRDDGAVICPYFVPVVAATRINVQNLQPTSRGWILFHEVWLAEA